MSTPRPTQVIKWLMDSNGLPVSLYGNGTIGVEDGDYGVETLRELLEYWDYVQEIGDDWEEGFQ